MLHRTLGLELREGTQTWRDNGGNILNLGPDGLSHLLVWPELNQAQRFGSSSPAFGVYGIQPSLYNLHSLDPYFVQEWFKNEIIGIELATEFGKVFVVAVHWYFSV
jgi:hypothetical protein